MEDYKKKYEQALKRAIKWASQPTVWSSDDICQKIFPELKESWDDVMRKMAIKAVYAPEAQSCIKSWGVEPKDVIAWLEKQGEQKTTWSEEDEEMIKGLNNCLSELEEKNGWRYTYVNNKDVKLDKIRNWLKSLKERMKGE